MKTLPALIPDKEKKLLNFYFHTFLWCIKPFEAPQRSVKIKIEVNFYFNKTLENAQGGKVKSKNLNVI